MKTKHAQNLVEYALILAFVTLIAVTVLSYLSKKVDSVFQDTNYNKPAVEVEAE